MVDEGAYEIVPYKEIMDLKKQIDELKRKGSVSSEDLMHSMTNLTKSMDGMLNLFKAAAEEMKSEEKGASLLSEKIDPLMDKLDKVIEQNEIIADGMVSIADTVKELKGEKLPTEPPVMPKDEFSTELPEQKKQTLPIPPSIPPFEEKPTEPIHDMSSLEAPQLKGEPPKPPAGPPGPTPPGMPPLGPMPPGMPPVGPMPPGLPPVGPMPPPGPTLPKEPPLPFGMPPPYEKKKGLFSGLFKKK